MQKKPNGKLRVEMNGEVFRLLRDTGNGLLVFESERDGHKIVLRKPTGGAGIGDRLDVIMMERVK